MKKISFLALFCALTLSTFAQNQKETRTLPLFTGIDASSAFSIELKRGDTQSVVIECDAQYMPDIKTEVKGGVLHLYYKSPVINRRINSAFRAYITITDLDFLDLSGASSIASTDLFTPKRFRADLSGASKVFGLRINTNDAGVEISGASVINIEIECDRASFDFSGSGRGKVSGKISQCNLGLSGASKAEFFIHTDQISLEASGACNTNIKGEANRAKVSVSGASTLQAQNFIVKEMKISASGASKASVHVTELLSPTLSSSSRLDYQGSPRIDNLRVTSGASINNR